MKSYKSARGNGALFILSLALVYDAVILSLMYFINSYILLNLLNLTLAVLNVYLLYYLLLSLSLEYRIEDEGISIVGIFGFKKITLLYKEIYAYRKSEGRIHGVKLTGIGKNTFAFGKSIVDKIGFTSMFVTSNKAVIYLKTEGITYALSPKEFESFELELNHRGLQIADWKYNKNKNVNLYKEKHFIIPFCIVSIVILILTLNPFILYLQNKLPAIMPLSFDAHFTPIKMGTGKQFAFYQMMYGALNMIILFCMYYASYFYAKYDKKSAYKFIYISLLIAVLFLFIQLKILITF